MHGFWQEGDTALLGHVWVGGCSSSLTFALTIDIYKTPDRREHLHHLLSFPLSAAFSSLSVLYKLCCHKPAAQSLVTHEGVRYLPLSNHFFLSPHFFFYHHQALTSQHLCDSKSSWVFSFSLSSVVATREACSGCVASSSSWRRQQWDFLPVSFGRARSSHCCIPRSSLRHSVGFKQPSSSPTAQLFLLSALHFYMEKTKALHPISGYLSHIQEFVCLGFPLGIE